MASKRIAHVWFNAQETIGIVLAYDEIEKKPKAWIARGHGMNKEADLEHIQAWGAKFPPLEATSLIISFGTVEDRELFSLVEKQVISKAAD